MVCNWSMWVVRVCMGVGQRGMDDGWDLGFVRGLGVSDMSEGFRGCRLWDGVRGL